MKNLIAFDEYIITDEERVTDASFGMRFRSLNHHMKLHTPDFVENITAEQHLFNVDVDVYRLKRIFEKNSPCVRIQSLFRGFRARKSTVFSMSRRITAIVMI
jgi:hypothetical protein